jgi:hypothetical protein
MGQYGMGQMLDTETSLQIIQHISQLLGILLKK